MAVPTTGGQADNSRRLYIDYHTVQALQADQANASYVYGSRAMEGQLSKDRELREQWGGDNYNKLRNSPEWNDILFPTITDHGTLSRDFDKLLALLASAASLSLPGMHSQERALIIRRLRTQIVGVVQEADNARILASWNAPPPPAALSQAAYRTAAANLDNPLLPQLRHPQCNAHQPDGALRPSSDCLCRLLHLGEETQFQIAAMQSNSARPTTASNPPTQRTPSSTPAEVDAESDPPPPNTYNTPSTPTNN